MSTHVLWVLVFYCSVVVKYYRREERKLEYMKSRIRSKVEFVFHIVKDIFGWRKARYKGIYKNHCQANILYASANLYMLSKIQVETCHG